MEGNSLSEINTTINFEQTWCAVVGKTISNNTEIINIKNEKIIIKTSNPIWRNELTFQKKELLEQLNNEKSQLNIKDIIFR